LRDKTRQTVDHGNYMALVVVVILVLQRDRCAGIADHFHMTVVVVHLWIMHARLQANKPDTLQRRTQRTYRKSHLKRLATG